MHPMITEILALCVKISSAGKWHAFFDFSGHVDGLTVGVTPADHDYQGDKPGYRSIMTVFGIHTSETASAELAQLKAKLEDFA